MNHFSKKKKKSFVNFYQNAINWFGAKFEFKKKKKKIDDVAPNFLKIWKVEDWNNLKEMIYSEADVIIFV